MHPVHPGKIYKHYKGGRYLVLHLASDSTNGRNDAEGVVYVSLAYGILKYRELAEFVEEVQWPDGAMRPRFIPE